VPHLRRSLLAVAIAFLAMGAGFAVAPAASRVPARTVAGGTPPDSVASGGGVDADSLAEEIVIANIFDATRTPPSSRYTPPEIADTVAGALAEALMMDTTAVGAGGPQLFGTLVGGDGARALLQFDVADTAPRLYGVGERAHGYRVVSIAPREVVLSGPAGRVVLRLPPEEERP
jgi:hypothetical protein